MEKPHPKTQAEFEAMLKEDPDNPELHNNLGLLFYRDGHYKAAEDKFRYALQLRSDYIAAMFNLALALKPQQKQKECLACLSTLITVDQKNIQALFMLGKIHLENKLDIDAQDYFEKIIRIIPDDVDILKNIAYCALENHHLDLAKSYCDKTIKLQPENFEILYNLGFIHERQGKIKKAISYYHEALLHYPDYYDAINNLAVIHLQKQDLVNARIYFERAFKLKPDDKSIQHTLNAITGKKTTDEAPTEYIKNLFDYYADHFDQHLVGGLDYKVPQLLLDVFKKAAKPKEKHYQMLDLGCGTGLVGEAFNPYAKELIGVDLSEKMLDIARNKVVYQKLIADDVLHYLSDNEENYDVIIAADVLVYFGKLELLFERVAQRLKNGGYFLFSIEITDGELFTLQKSGRFAHSKPYLLKLAKHYQLRLIDSQQAETRTQFEQPVEGGVFLLQH